MKLTRYNLILFLNIICLSCFAFGDDSIVEVTSDDICLEDSSCSDVDFESEMMLFEDIPVVYSVSRFAQEMDDVSVPVNIIDNNDIHYSGATNIADLLKYNLGVDMLMANRNLYRFTMGGLRYAFYDRNVTLINGRNLNSPINGGTDFLGIPVFLEDIERIEIVRGSGGASWGTNGFAGVVNIVTKRPEDITPGFLYSGTINEYGDIYNNLRWADHKGSWQWRMSVGFDDWTSTEDAARNDTKEIRDFSRVHRFDSEAIVELNDLMELSFGAAYSRAKRGDLYQKDLVGFYNPYLPTTPVHSHFETSRFFTKLERKMDDNYSFHLQWFGNLEEKREFFNLNARSIENDVEFQVDLDLEKHNLSFGSNFRHYAVDNIHTSHSYNFLKNKYLDFQTGAFIIDRWDIAEKLDLEFQLRGDYFSDTKETNYAGRAAAIYDLSEAYNQKLRFSVNRSYRAPSYSWKYGYFKTVAANPDMNNEQMLSYQAGYSMRPTDKIKIEVDGHYHQYKDTIGISVTQWDPVFGPVALMADNNGDLDVLGAEGKVTFDLDNSDIELWCAYDDIDLNASRANLTSIAPARLRFGVSNRYFLPDNWVFNTQYKYSGEQFITQNSDSVDGYNDLTVALSKGFAQGNGEVMVGVSNLCSDDYNYFQGIDETMHTVGRTFFGRLQIKF